MYRRHFAHDQKITTPCRIRIKNVRGGGGGWEEEEEAAGPWRCPRAVAQRAVRGAGKAAGAAQGKVVCSSLELAQVLSPDTLPNRTVTL
jgi:hypothetical protein